MSGVSLLMIQRIPCKACGEQIHPDTASKSDGLCMPCKGGYRARIEEGKRHREAEKQYEQSAERKYWLALVQRVHHEAGGFSALPAHEKAYYAVTCLIGEVYNGGFHQYFSNSSGEHYGYALDGLMELEAGRSTELLLQARELFFGSQLVPLDRAKRNQMLPSIAHLDSSLNDLWSRLDTIEKEFWSDPDHIGQRCNDFAAKHGLY